MALLLERCSAAALMLLWSVGGAAFQERRFSLTHEIPLRCFTPGQVFCVQTDLFSLQPKSFQVRVRVRVRLLHDDHVPRFVEGES